MRAHWGMSVASAALVDASSLAASSASESYGGEICVLARTSTEKRLNDHESGHELAR